MNLKRGRLTSLAVAIGNLLGTTGKFVFGSWYVIAIILDVLFVMMTGYVVQLFVNTAGKDERRKGVEVGQKNYRVNDLGQGPTVRAFGQFL